MSKCRPFFLLSDSAREECTSALPTPPSDAPYDSVVVGLAPSLLHYNNLTTAFRILVGEHETSPSRSRQTARTNIPLIATHKAKYIQSSSGLSLGPGPFVQALENAAGVTAEIVGKPTRAFFQAVIDDLGLEDTPEEGKIVIVGDDIQSDLGGGALELGLWRVLGKIAYFIRYPESWADGDCAVKTGKYRAGDESRAGVEPPDEVCQDFATFVDSLLEDGSMRARL